MKKVLAILILLLSCAFQDNEYVLVNTINAPVSLMVTDNLGHVFLVSNNEVKKYDADGKLLKTYSNRSYGDITSIDVTDPLNTLLFYKDFRKVLFLDNMLSEKGDPIDLDDLTILQPACMCNSYEGGFWVFDQQDMQLVRYDKSLQVSSSSGNLSQLTGMDVKPNFLIEVNNMIYLNNPETGILVFDKFGTYAKMFPFKGLTSFQIIENSIIYRTQSSLVRYDWKSFEEQSMKMPVEDILNARIEKNRVYVQDSTSVRIYDVK